MNLESNIIYNKQYLVIVPYTSQEYYESLSYTLKNTIFISKKNNELNRIIKFINNNNIGDIIFVDYLPDYNLIINSLVNKHRFKAIFTKTLGELSDINTYDIFKNIINMYNEKIIQEIATIDINLYKTLKNSKVKCKNLLLDIKCSEQKNLYYNNTIGILNNQNSNYHSYYNELSAISLYDNDIAAKIEKPSKETKKFLKLFDIKTVKSTSNNLYKNNLVNMNINFATVSILNFLKSMDNNVPCIVGNNDFLDDKLKEMLMVKSDDNINEISQKIGYVIKNRDKILKEYKLFRKKYTEKSIKLGADFIGYHIIKDEEKKYDKILSVIVPVYNTSKYLKKSLNSIIEASINDMEVIIINDGSTDDSDKIINEYVSQYPYLFKYIKQDNKGLGNVRNVGLSVAQGKYIASVDSDDTINASFFSDAFGYMEKDVDIILYDWKSINEDKTTFLTPAIEGVFTNKNKYEGLLYSTIMPSTCNKIIKKSLYDSLSIKYLEDKYEDLSTNPIIMLKANTIKYINEPYYEYYLRSGSLMRTSAGYSMINVIVELDKRIKKIDDYINISLDEFKYYTYSWRIEEYILNQLYTIDEKDLSKYIKYIYNNIYDIIVEVFNNSLYKSMLNNLENEEMKKYIEQRNKMIEQKKLEDFIIKSRNKATFYKLNPVIIYYGDKHE